MAFGRVDAKDLIILAALAVAAFEIMSAGDPDIVKCDAHGCCFSAGRRSGIPQSIRRGRRYKFRVSIWERAV